MKFKNRFESLEIIGHDFSDDLVVDYDFKLGIGGVVDIIKVGERHLQDEINSYLKDTALEYVLERYKKTGDLSLLNVNSNGVFADISDIPHNTLEAMNYANEAVSGFDDLDDDIKKGRDLADFVKNAKPDDFIKQEKEIKTEEKIENA